TFAALPEGQDPDDLVRAGGREAVADVLASARPLAEMLWLRETEAGGFDTPERRAALEQRMAEVTNAIADQAVRKYYPQDLEARVARLFAPAETLPPQRRGAPGRFGERRDRWRGAGRQQLPHDTLRPSSPRLASSQIVRGARSALPVREALILLAVV